MFNYNMEHFKRGGLRLWILSTLEKSPKNGAEIINQIALALVNLITIGSIKKREDDKYELTEKGQQELEWPPGNSTSIKPRNVEKLIDEMESNTSYLEDLKASDKAKIEFIAQRLRTIKGRIKYIITS